MRGGEVGGNNSGSCAMVGFGMGDPERQLRDGNVDSRYEHPHPYTQ